MENRKTLKNRIERLDEIKKNNITKPEVTEKLDVPNISNKLSAKKAIKKPSLPKDTPDSLFGLLKKRLDSKLS